MQQRLEKILEKQVKLNKMAGWQSGHAADCKSVYAGSIPASASIKKSFLTIALVIMLIQGGVKV